MSKLDRVRAAIAAVRAEFAIDPRLAIFDVRVRIDNRAIELFGATSEPAAAEALHRRLAMLDGGSELRNRVIRLPESDDPAAQHAVVSAAVAPMLAIPDVAGPLVSQAVLGSHLLILRRSGRWLNCRSDDGYYGWIHRGYLCERQSAVAICGEPANEGEWCVSLGAEVYNEAGDILVRLPWGARVIRLPNGSLRLPDGRGGTPTGDLVSAADRPRRFPSDGPSVVATAPRWLGAPYLWSGVTPAGVDCSGLVQALFRTHGVELPRDSDLQAGVGDPIDPGPDFSALRPGDLLFFAEEAGRVTHVALSAGGTRLIHSSLGNGGVRWNELAGPLDLERELARLFVCARRIV